MSYDHRRPALEQALLDAGGADALEAAMRAVAALAQDLANPAFVGREMFCRGLDATVPVLARRLGLADRPAPRKSNDDVCILGTRFYSHGGHSKVAEDIARLIGAERTTLAMTNIYDELDQLRLLQLFKDAPLQRRATLVLSAGTLPGKVFELYNLMAALRPTRIFLLNHHFDLVALTALWPFRDVVDFLHHADHLPGLGATLPWSRHVDLTWTCHQACAAADLSPIYSGMTVPRAAAATATLALPPKAPGTLRIATCGAPSKYRGRGAYRWRDYAVAALRLPEAELIHIGPVDEALRADILARKRLAEAGIAPERYVFAGVSGAVAADLQAHAVDVFLSSYPEPGGKAGLEAMTVGLPPIVPADPDAPDLMRFGFPLETLIHIRAPAELAAAVAAARGPRAMTPNDRAAVEAELARFERYVLDASS